MAEDLGDLPTDSVQHAIQAWRRGDTSHLSGYLQDHTRIGIFFPKPAELRAIAEFHLERRRQRQRDQDRIAEDERLSRHRAEHPEDYISMADVMRDVHARGRAKLLEASASSAQKPPACEACASRVLAALSPADLRAIADLKDEQVIGGA